MIVIIVAGIAFGLTCLWHTDSVSSGGSTCRRRTESSVGLRTRSGRDLPPSWHFSAAVLSLILMQGAWSQTLGNGFETCACLTALGLCGIRRSLLRDLDVHR